jgi:hypothetical protein
MSSYSFALEQEIRQLRSDLYIARCTILELLPESVRKAIGSYHGPKSYEELYRWEHEVVDRLVDIAQPKRAEEMGDYLNLSDRAYCPLCAGSAQTIYGGNGYAFPEGLRRHLEGSHNSQRCSIFEAIRGLCRESVRSELERQEYAKGAEVRPKRGPRGQARKRPS